MPSYAPALNPSLPKIGDSEKKPLESMGVRNEAKCVMAAFRFKFLREIREGNYDLVVTGLSLSRSSARYI